LRDEHGAKLSEKEAMTKKTLDKANDLEARLRSFTANSTRLEERLKQSEDEVHKVCHKMCHDRYRAASILTSISQMTSQLEQKDQEKQAVQSELDDLLMVFGDLEEKAAKYKVREGNSLSVVMNYSNQVCCRIVSRHWVRLSQMMKTMKTTTKNRGPLWRDIMVFTIVDTGGAHPRNCLTLPPTGSESIILAFQVSIDRGPAACTSSLVAGYTLYHG
jgi:seryl-tRNA synthetase